MNNNYNRPRHFQHQFPQLNRERSQGLKVIVRRVEGVKDEKVRKELEAEELNKALKVLSKRVEKEGVLKAFSERKFYRKPSEIKRSAKMKAIRDRNKKKNKIKKFY